MSPFHPDHHSPRSAGIGVRGFTLLEVLLSVSIFLLLAGGIFTAVTVTTKASAEVALVRRETERFDALQRFLRQVFSNLPASTQLELRVRPVPSLGRAVEVLIAPAPEFADLSAPTEQAGDLALGAIPDGTGALTFSLTNFNGTLSTTERDRQLENASWIPLLPGVADFRWRFAGTETSGLQETWEPANGRPALADLVVTMTDGTIKHWQFLIPELARPTSETSAHR